ncbi:MAG: AmpG family muropeptide MFS transporter, partial [Proteobacteria bacterium]|nr:AmpG family muropeptide MFS transporter [Pseudomonadota bacterium]
MLFLGFSAGLPILLIFSSLSLWLREADVSRSAVTFFSWAALGYSFKFIWAPLIDKLPVPLLSRVFGRRRSWLLLAQASIVLAILWMSSIDPANGQTSLNLMALAAVLLGFSSATQDIVIDAYRIESADESLQALMSSSYIAGYRIGMLLAGAGALFLADAFGTTMEAYDYSAWQWAYRIMAMSMGIGILTTLVISEPVPGSTADTTFSSKDSLSLVILFICVVIAFIGGYILTQGIADHTKALSALLHNQAMASVLIASLRLAISLLAAFLTAGLLVKLNWIDAKLVFSSYIDPLRDFFGRYGVRLAWLLLALISVYR